MQFFSSPKGSELKIEAAQEAGSMLQKVLPQDKMYPLRKLPLNSNLLEIEFPSFGNR